MLEIQLLPSQRLVEVLYLLSRCIRFQSVAVFDACLLNMTVNHTHTCYCQILIMCQYKPPVLFQEDNCLVCLFVKSN